MTVTRRRTVLAGVAATAGCLSVPNADAEDRHPFAGETVTVRVDEQTDSQDNIRTVTETMLLFPGSSSKRCAAFSFEFELTETRTTRSSRTPTAEEDCSDTEGDSTDAPAGGEHPGAVCHAGGRRGSNEGRTRDRPSTGSGPQRRTQRY
ncbi:MAG: hypothetical protein J07HX64_00393 [halophilic archaeon J07HX64]|nr:MAG: hypothetical protein J07HX64_00393 [halophilic archaeon J07HX64]